jgi:hypothetical protein
MGEVTRSLGCLLILALGGSSLGCHHGKKGGAPSASVSAEAVATAAPSASGLEVAPAAMLEPATRVGAALARSPDGKRLYVADEDRKLLHVLRLPLTGAPVASVSLPGAPAQVVVLADRLLVTIRHPSLLWVGRTEGDNVTELGRASLPEDAWGVTLLPHENSALVSSAWASQCPHCISCVDARPICTTAAPIRWRA